MSNITDNNPIIQEAYIEMQRFYANPETQEKARQRRRFLIDYNLGISSSKAEGHAEGTIQKAMDIALGMKKEGFDLALIARLTGLTPEKINQLD